MEVGGMGCYFHNHIKISHAWTQPYQLDLVQSCSIIGHEKDTMIISL